MLLVCYHFPPVGGPAVGRPLALFKHLPDFGYRCDVLTVKTVAHRVWEPELLEGHDSSRIFRAGSRDPQRLMYLLGIKKVRDAHVGVGKSISQSFFPDSQVGWVQPAIRLGRTLAASNHYEAVVSTSPPISNHLVAQQLAKELGVPWVADFRDFWTRRRAEDSYRNRKQVQKAFSLLDAIRRQAAAITAVTPSIAEYTRADRVIYNSYDDDLAALWRSPPERGGFVIGLLGTLDDVCPVAPLFKILTAMRKQAPLLFEKTRLLQVGRVDEGWLKRQLTEYELLERCEVHNFQKRADTIGILSEASLFYLGLGSRHDRGVTPGRIYTLLASGRRILAAVPPGSDVEVLLGETGGGQCFWEETIGSALAYLCRQIEQHRDGALAITPRPAYAQPYSSRNLARRFADIFDRLGSR